MTDKPQHRAHTALPLLLALATGCSGAGRLGEIVPTGRLPGTAVPRHYELALAIDPAAERFHGDVTIALELARATRTIWMHGERIEPSAVAFTLADETIEGEWHDEGDDVVAIRLPRSVGPGRGSLRIRYSAKFDERLRGLYHVVADGRAYAFTQFEPLDARQAFPSFDEPAYKTPYDITLTVPAGNTAITNTAARSSETLPNGSIRTQFHTTVPLPTYLIAFAVGPFDVVDGPAMPPRASRRHAVPLRGITVAGRGPQIAFALEHTPPLLFAFEDWFDSPLPYDKLDIIAVPDFGSGAMENAGAITFRDSLLLFGDTISARNRRSFTYVTAHELAHTWFGNTVTMPWWNDIWLNEAFATWHGNRIVATVAPEQNAEIAMLDGVHRAMHIDGRESARAIRQPIQSNHDVHNAFDPITYSKGAGVLSMFEHWIGPEKFRRGVRSYIEAHRDGNATTDDLLSALSAAAERDVAKPFNSFLVQPGVPLVAAEVQCDAQGARLQLHQERYVPLGSTASRDARWQIPICVRTGLDGETRQVCGLLTTSSGQLPLAACPDWSMPNASAAGYYRFTQPPADTQRLIERGFSSLEATERLSVANNLDAAFRAGAPLTSTFSAFAVLASDESRGAAMAPMSLLQFARDRLATDQDQGALEEFVAGLYTLRMEEVGWEPKAGEDGETALLRRAVVDTLAFNARDTAVRAEAARRAERYTGIDGVGPADATALAPDLIDVGLRVAVEDGGTRVFDALVAQLHESDDALERHYRLAALGAAKEPALVARAQALSLDERLRVNETTTTLWPLMMRPDTQERTWTFVEENFDALVERSGPGRAGQLPWLLSGLCSRDAADRANNFLAPYAAELAGGPRNLAGSVESIRQCAALKEAHADSLHRFLTTRTTP